MNIKGDDEKVALYRVVMLKDKKDEFINECRRSLRIYAKEYNNSEIQNMSKEQSTKEDLEKSIAQKKVKYK